MITTYPAFEKATCNDVTAADGLVTKVTRRAFADLPAAEALGEQLAEYHAAIAAGPLAVAELLSTSVREEPDGYRVQHIMEWVPGTPVSRLPYGERREAVNELVQTTQRMPSLPGEPTKVQTPYDANIRNFVRRPDGALVLVDISPSYVWGKDGYVSTALEPDLNADWRQHNTAAKGCRAGIMATLIVGAAPDRNPQETAADHLKRIMRTESVWQQGLVPDNLPPPMQEDLLVRVHMNFAGRLARVLAAGGRQLA